MRRSAACGAVLLAAGAAAAERPDPSPITDRFALRGIYYSGSVATDVRLDAQSGAPGTRLSAEDDLGLDDRIDQGRIELLVRARERHRLRADYFKVDRFAGQALGRDVDFGDQSFGAGEQLASSLDWRMLGVTYAYSALRAERFEIGAGAGVHLLEAQASGEVPARAVREEASAVGAFPTLAVDGTWRISQRVSLLARGQYFSASVDELDGSLGDYHLDLQYRWRPNLAAGLGYSYLRVRLEVSDAELPGLLHLDVKGPELFFRVSF